MEWQRRICELCGHESFCRKVMFKKYWDDKSRRTTRKWACMECFPLRVGSITFHEDDIVINGMLLEKVLLANLYLLEELDYVISGDMIRRPMQQLIAALRPDRLKRRVTMLEKQLAKMIRRVENRDDKIIVLQRRVEQYEKFSGRGGENRTKAGVEIEEGVKKVSAR